MVHPPSYEGPAEYFTDTVRIDPLFKAPELAREWRKRHVGAGAVRVLRIRLVKTLLAGLMAFWSCEIATLAQDSSPSPSSVDAEHASEIPKGYEICENESSHRRVAGLPEAEENEKAISRDGRFAMICPLRDTADANDKYPPNLLVRLKPYAVLAKLNKEGVPSNASLEINATWEDDSTVAIWEYYRWGIVDLTIYEIDNDKVKRVHHVMDEARKIFERDIRTRLLKKYPKEYDSITFLSDEDKTKEAPDFKFDGRKVQIYLAADNKPNLAPGPHWTAELNAVWNLNTGKLEKVDFQPGEVTVRKPQD